MLNMWECLWSSRERKKSTNTGWVEEKHFDVVLSLTIFSRVSDIITLSRTIVSLADYFSPHYNWNWKRREKKRSTTTHVILTNSAHCVELLALQTSCIASSNNISIPQCWKGLRHWWAQWEDSREKVQCAECREKKLQAHKIVVSVHVPSSL